MGIADTRQVARSLAPRPPQPQLPDKMANTKMPLLLVGLAGLCLSSGASGAKQPHILFVVADGALPRLATVLHGPARSLQSPPPGPSLAPSGSRRSPEPAVCHPRPPRCCLT